MLMKNPRVIPPVAMGIAALAMWGTALATGTVRPAGDAVMAVVFALLVAGLLLMAVAALQFARAKTTINPLRPARASALVTGGLFRISRNPIYVGDVLLLAALALWLGSWPGAVWVAAFVFYIDRWQIGPEEAALAGLFGDEYRAYCSRVRRWV